MTDWREQIKGLDIEALRKSLVSNAETIDTTISPSTPPIEDAVPEIKIEPTENKSLVDSIIEKGDDPNVPMVPEDKFGLPDQLTTIDSLRKKGFDNERIFNAMELLEEQRKEKEANKDKPKEKSDKNTPTISIQEDDDYWDRLLKPTKAYFLAGGLKQDFGGVMQQLGTVKPREARSFRNKEGFEYNFGEVTQEQAMERTLENPLFKLGQKSYMSGIQDFASRPDLQPTENFMDYEWSDPEFVASAIGQALPSFLSFVVPTATVAITTKNPALTFATTMATAYGMEAGSMYNQAIEEGLTPQEASNVAVTVGTINSLISLIPVGGVFSKLGISNKAISEILTKSVIRKQLFKNVGSKAFVGGTTEVIEELLQETTNIIAETQALGKEFSEEEIIKRLQAVSVGGGFLGLGGGGVSGAVQTNTDVKEAGAIEGALREKIIIETQAQMINDDNANDFNISFDNNDDGSRPITESEIIERGYKPEQFPLIGENENGEKEYGVRVKGTTDSKGNISLSSRATGSTILEEIVESRLKKLRTSKNIQERALADKIEIWAESVRKKALEMGLELRFGEEGEGNLELFSDAIVYTKGGFTGLDQKFEDTIYIPDDLANDFINIIGEMSDGTQIFDALKADGPGIAPNQEFASGIDAEMKSQMFPKSKSKRGPPSFKTPKPKKSKTSNQIEPDSPAFKKWFGDSKLVNDDGSPMVLFHGTNKNRREMANINTDGNDFTTFESNQDIQWFGNNTIANEYAFGPLGVADGSMYPVYLKSENPKIFEDISIEASDPVKVSQAEEILGVDLSQSNYSDDAVVPFYQLVNDSETVRQLKEQGFDSIVIEEKQDKLFNGSSITPTIGVFDPTQIKSTFNQGTFDENNANISYQLEPAQVQTAIDKYPPIIGTKKESMIGALKKRLENPKTASMGLPKNQVQVHEMEGGGIIVTGAGKTHEHFKMQVESMLNEDEVIKSSNWYDEAYPEFEKQFGDDAIPAMMSWLISNQNASPSVALSNTFLAIEQLKADIPSFKKAGLNAEQVKNIMSGDRATQGAGEKLFDFADSALSKKYRTIMQDNPIGLGPVAVDRHTFRDTGFVDATLKTALLKYAVDKEAVKNILYDDPNNNGPTTTQYQQGVKKVNEWTDALNAEGWMGIEWTPAKVQAVGWTAMARLTRTSEGMSIPDSFSIQNPTIAFEVEFGEGSGYNKSYGDAYKELSIKEANKAVKQITKDIVPDLAKKMGLRVDNVSYKGTGGWNGDVNANITIQVMGSNQAIGGFMNALGYIYEQSEIGRLNHLHGSNDLGLVIYSPGLDNVSKQEAVYQILSEETDTKLVPGYTYQKMTDSLIGNNVPSMVIGSEGLKQKDIENYGVGLEVAQERIRNELDIDIKFMRAGVKYESKENNWSKNPDGRKYRDAISQSFGKSLQDELDNNYRPRIQKRLKKTLTSSKRKQLKSYQLEPDTDLASQLDAQSRLETPLDISEENYHTISGIGKALRRGIIDSMDPVISLQEDIKSAYLGEASIREQIDVALKAELSVGRIPELIKDFDTSAIDGKNPDSFVSRLNSELGMDVDEFSDYVYAKHAEVRNKHIKNKTDGEMENGSGISSAEAKRIRSELNKKYGLKKLNKYVKEFRETFIDPEIKMRYEAGLLSEEDYNNLTDPKVNPIAKDYVPLFREFDDADVTVDSSTGQGFDIKGSEYKKAKGSERKVQNVIISSAERMHSAIIRSEKNQVNKTLLGLVESFPSTAYEVRGMSYKPEYDSDGEISYLTPMEEGQRTKDGTRITKDNTVNVKVDGKVKQIIFKGDQGAKIARAMKDMGVKRVHKSFSYFLNYLRYVSTIGNPEFIFSNFLRDIQTAGINIGAEQGSVVRNSALSPKNLKSAWSAVFNVVRNNELDSEWAQLYERMRLAGGKTGFFDLKTIEEKIGNMKSKLESVDKDGSKIVAGARSITDFIEQLNEATESAVRLSLFKAMLENGYSEAQSASGAKNVTINFNRKGEWGTVLNTAYLFANAGLQGSMRIFTVVKKSKKAQKAVAGLAVMGIMESLYNQMADVYNEEDEEYDKLNDWEKDNYFIARYGKEDYFKFRMPYGFNVFKVAGNIAGDAIWASMNGDEFNKTDASWRFVNAFMNSYSPVGTGPVEQVLSPTLIDPIVQLSTNTNFYGAPIYPSEYKYMDPDVIKTWQSTPELYKDASQALFKMQGNKLVYDKDGNPTEAYYGPGAGWDGDVSPETLEYFVDFIGGGLGKTIINTLETGISLFDKDTDFNINNTPIVRQFFGTYKKDSEKRILYNLEREMRNRQFSPQEAFKYKQYLDHAVKKKQLTVDEKLKRIKKFNELQRIVKNVLNRAE